MRHQKTKLQASLFPESWADFSICKPRSNTLWAIILNFFCQLVLLNNSASGSFAFLFVCFFSFFIIFFIGKRASCYTCGPPLRSMARWHRTSTLSENVFRNRSCFPSWSRPCSVWNGESVAKVSSLLGRLCDPISGTAVCCNPARNFRPLQAKRGVPGRLSALRKAKQKLISHSVFVVALPV